MEIYLVAAILPVIVLGYFIYKKDINKEPPGLLRKIFIFGFFSSIPVLIVELNLDSIFSTDNITSFPTIFINVFFGVALVEEGFKWLITKFVGYNSEEFDEIYDIIVYAVFASLGFACIENIIYVLYNGLLTALLRAVLSIPGHTCFAVLMGYYFSKAKLASVNKNKLLYFFNLFLSILVPSIFHAFYDAFLDANMFEAFLVFDVVMVFICFRIVNKVSKMQQTFENNVDKGNIIQESNGTVQYNNQFVSNISTQKRTINFCPVCGTRILGGNFCPTCGFKIK
jgi:RsiW-degrading membrane proteinase PrsW (M82 family)